jgi:1-acylglycerone phosphate reductase
MRLELSPWGIKCILVVEGEIRTKFFENLPEVHHIPQGSLYSPAKTEVEHGMSGADLEKSAMDVDAAAIQIVANALKSNPKKHQWIGGGASTIWSANAFGWSTIWVSLVLHKF